MLVYLWVQTVLYRSQLCFCFITKDTLCCPFLTKSKANIIEAFNSTSRVLDDLLTERMNDLLPDCGISWVSLLIFYDAITL